MDPNASAIRASTDVATPPRETFETLVDELAWALAREGFRFEDGPSGRLVRGEFEVGSVSSWEPGERIVLEWRPVSWKPAETTEIELRFEPIGEGTRVDLVHHNWGRVLEDGSDQIGWFATEVVAPHFVATAPESFGTWLTDR